MKKAIFVLLVACLPCFAKNKIAFFTVKSNDPTYSMEIILDSKAEGDYADKGKYRVVALSSALPGGDWKWIDLNEVRFNADNSIDLVPANPADVKNAAQLMVLVGSDPGVAAEVGDSRRRTSVVATRGAHAAIRFVAADARRRSGATPS